MDIVQFSRSAEIVVNGGSQAEEKYPMTFLICRIYKEMVQMNSQNRNKLTDLDNKLMLATGGRIEGRDSEGVWDWRVHTAGLTRWRSW